LEKKVQCNLAESAGYPAGAAIAGNFALRAAFSIETGRAGS
jgi:hypothetical protein